MRRRFIPIKVIIIAGLLVLLSLGPDQNNPPKEVMERGKYIFETECGTCHHPADTIGSSDTLSAKTQWALGSKKQLIKIVLYGQSDSAKVAGNIYRHPIPLHQQFSDEQVSDVLTYVRNSFGNRAVSITPEEVKKVRLARAKKMKSK